MKGSRSRLLLWPVVLSAVALVSILITQTAVAESTPLVSGQFSGIELCPQFLCGEAIFIYHGLFEVDGTATRGFGSIHANHEPLPAAGGDPAAIEGGWNLWTFQGSFKGSFAGTLVNNGDDTFTATGQLTLTEGGVGAIGVMVVLDHNTFPQTLTGELSQDAPAIADTDTPEAEPQERHGLWWILTPFRWLSDLLD
jgi:hypothetical protein